MGVCEWVFGCAWGGWGCMCMGVGVQGCVGVGVWVCMGVGCARVWVGVHAWVGGCIGVCVCAWVCVSGGCMGGCMGGCAWGVGGGEWVDTWVCALRMVVPDKSFRRNNFFLF